MEQKKVVRISKYLSKHLRHSPEAIGLQLQIGGWVGVDDLLNAATKHGMRITRAELDEVVKRNNKQRFAFDETGQRIRASQGHSVEVDLQLDPQVPPNILYHGTARHTLDSILEKGLEKRSRHHVHLSVDRETATRVGSRHGVVVVLEVNAAGMQADGFEFFCSANGVWLTESIPPHYLEITDKGA
jgi:putative RNA 2'-phosphotransferase